MSLQSAVSDDDMDYLYNRILDKARQLRPSHLYTPFDLAGNVFLTVMQSIKNGDFEIRSDAQVSSYLKNAVRFARHNEYRRASRICYLDDLYEADNLLTAEEERMHETIDAKRQLDTIGRALATNDSWEITHFLFHFLRRNGIAQVRCSEESQTLGIAPNTLSQRMRRLRQRVLSVQQRVEQRPATTKPLADARAFYKFSQGDLLQLVLSPMMLGESRNIIIVRPESLRQLRHDRPESEYARTLELALARLAVAMISVHFCLDLSNQDMTHRLERMLLRAIALLRVHDHPIFICQCRLVMATLFLQMRRACCAAEQLNTDEFYWLLANKSASICTRAMAGYRQRLLHDIRMTQGGRAPQE